MGSMIALTGKRDCNRPSVKLSFALRLPYYKIRIYQDLAIGYRWLLHSRLQRCPPALTIRPLEWLSKL